MFFSRSARKKAARPDATFDLEQNVVLQSHVSQATYSRPPVAPVAPAAPAAAPANPTNAAAPTTRPRPVTDSPSDDLDDDDFDLSHIGQSMQRNLTVSRSGRYKSKSHQRSSIRALQTAAAGSSGNPAGNSSGASGSSQARTVDSSPLGTVSMGQGAAGYGGLATGPGCSYPSRAGVSTAV